MRKLVFIFVLLLLFPSLAFSFPFRSVSPGAEIPSVSLKKIDGADFMLSPAAVKSKGLILFFWGANSEAKKKRTIEILKILNGVADSNQEIGVVAINAQMDTQAVVNEVVGRTKPHYPVLLDDGRKAYNAFGVFVMPSILIVDGHGRVLTGFGYSNAIEEKIKTQALVLLGKISEKEAMQKHSSQGSAKTEQERKALQHFRLGRKMESMRMLGKAKDEYICALKLFALPEAHMRLGMLYLDDGELKKAEEQINKGFDLAPDSVAAKIAHAKLRIAKGDVEGVVQDLHALSFRAPKNYAVHYTLGLAYEAGGELKNSVKEYKKAFELLKREISKQ